jgi:hypothetical protein
MSWRYAGLTAILLLTLVASHVPRVLKKRETIPPAWLIPPSSDDPESALAMGEKLALACADLSSIELIKGISDTLAFELLDKRHDIIRAALKGSQLDAIQRAHGIGAKTAEKLLPYIDLTAPCSVTERYEVLKDPNPPLSHQSYHTGELLRGF